MPTYNPGVFAKLYNTPLGKRLWDALNEHDNVIRMETATDLGRPALEPLEVILLKEFGEDVLDDRIKKMVGHMARQVMEACGYLPDAKNVKLMGGGPFSRATRYKDPDQRTFHVFRATDNPRQLALTFEKDSANLPDEKWVYWKSFRGRLRGQIAFGLKDEEKAAAAISATGYYKYQFPRLLRARS